MTNHSYRDLSVAAFQCVLFISSGKPAASSSTTRWDAEMSGMLCGGFHSIPWLDMFDLVLLIPSLNLGYNKPLAA